MPLLGRVLLRYAATVRRPLATRQPGPGAAVPHPAEEGFMLVAAVVMVALLAIAISVAAPMVARQLQRDREVESQHRMEEYVRAIQLYYRSFGNYPPSIKALENNNNIRFLRKVYVDPLTGKADYRLIHQGEQQTKIHVFFGQDLDDLAANLGGGSGMPGGAMGAMGATGGMAPGGPTSGSPTGGPGSGPGGSSTGSDFGGSSFGSSTSGPGSSSGTSGSNGGSGSSGGAGSSSNSDDDLDADTLGVIVGVGTSKTGTSITQPNGQTSYDAWEFWYDPKLDMLKQSVNVSGGGSGMTSQSASSFGQDAVTGQSNSGAGGSSAFGGSSFGSSSPSSSPLGSSGPNGANSNSPFSSSPF